MRFIHIADLHIGKSFFGTSLIESGDQGHWVDSFLDVARKTRPDAIVIAGDIFDRAAPSEEAVRLFSRMITSLHDMNIPVLVVAGNHDSVHRLSYFRELLSKQGVYFSRSLSDCVNGLELEHVTIEDEYGKVTFWLMPYVFPTLVRNAIEATSSGKGLGAGSDGRSLSERQAGRGVDTEKLLEEGRALAENTSPTPIDTAPDENGSLPEIRDYDAAVRALLAAQPLDPAVRNVLVAHQTVTEGGCGTEPGGSETMVAGIGGIDYTAFDAFDYVALGHIHAAYPIGRPEIRYSGSPLCYHFDETRKTGKGPLLVTLGSKNIPETSVTGIETILIEPLHPLREISGHYEEIRDTELESTARGEYISITIDNSKITPEIASFFRKLYEERGSVLMELKSEYSEFTGSVKGVTAEKLDTLSVDELFSEFYRESRGGLDPTPEEQAIMTYAAELLASGESGRRQAEPETINKLICHLLGSSETEEVLQ